MLKWITTLPARWVKYPGLHYGEPKLPYSPADKANKPVILLFGWLGASERHISKYTQLYQDKGYETIHYIPPMSVILYPSSVEMLNARLQADMMKLMKEKELTKRPFVLHVFSNSGYLNWCYYQQHLKSKVSSAHYNVWYRICGTVVDSAPCKLDPVVLTRGFLGALVPKITNHRHWLYTPLMEIFWSLFLRLPGNPEHFKIANSLIDNTVLPYPQWYFYSSGDTMLYASDIRKHIKRMEKKTNLPTPAVDFVTSNHVSHLRTHPVEYSKRIDAVLDRVETNWKDLIDVLAQPHSGVPLIRKRTRKVIRKKATKATKEL